MPCGSKESCNQDKNAANGHCAFEDLDHSALQQPLNLGVTNVKQILKCVQSGSKEVKDIILNECNIIYECKACVGLFRSLANFMYHKRCYCKKHLCEEMLLFEHFDETETITVQPEPPKEIPKVNVPETPDITDCAIDLVKSETAGEMNSDIPKDIKSATEMSDDSKGKATTSEHNPVKATTSENNPVKATTSENNPVKEKTVPVPEKVKNPMISRRTRDKNAQTPSPSTVKIPVKARVSGEPPLKCLKIISPKIISKESVVNKKNNQSDTSNKELKSKKVQFAKLTGNIDKNVPSFPKIIFKTIDANPHAVYQSNDKKKLDTFGISNKYEASTVETKVDNDKLIIVLKKDVKSDSTTSNTYESSKQKKDAEKASGFTLTRRNRLVVRNDCDVHELKCLVCKTQFMSLKTLYFHMLSLHSKKRLYYPCPFCKTLFVQMYGVTRHLIACHNKTKEQINKLRDVIKKKSVWKKIDDVTPASDSFSCVNYQVKTLEPPEEVKDEPKTIDNENNETDSLKTVIKVGKNVTLHQCSKCNRVFGRKSSQVSHEKFCIMNNAAKTEGMDVAVPMQQANPPVVSFLSLSPKSPATPKPASILQFNKPQNTTVKLTQPDIKINIRPKRGAEKRMHKDFVNSQTLKWRSANKIETNGSTNKIGTNASINKIGTNASINKFGANVSTTNKIDVNVNTKTSPTVKKHNAKNLEKKVLSFMNAEDLTCLKCHKKFSSYSNLRRHVAIHVGWTRFKCKYCDYQAYNKSQCWTHVQKLHMVDDSEMNVSIVNLVNSSISGKKSLLSGTHASTAKRSTEVSVKTSHSKTNNVPKVKISKKKSMNYSKNINSEKKQQQIQKRDLPELKNEEVDIENELVENKKDKLQLAIPAQKIPKKEISDPKQEKSQSPIPLQKFPRKEMIENKKEKPQHIIPIQKFTLPDYKREANYKSVTTSNPTTIILSKKVPSSTVQSIVTLSPEPMSSTSKISPIRTSPRKNEIKVPGERLITTLVTRSSAYSKSTPIQIKLPARSNSVEDISKDSPDKNCSKKERLISEWFPKKPVAQSPSIRRESAPLIIGLVPAGNAGAGLNARAKNSAISFDKSDS